MTLYVFHEQQILLQWLRPASRLLYIRRKLTTWHLTTSRAPTLF